MNLLNALKNGLQALQLECTEQQQQLLLSYLQLLEKWNQHFNLTAVRDIEQMLSLHLLDSLSIARFIHGQHILDVGTGAGLPGIPLAILYPGKSFTLLDSNGKKIRFCRQAIMQLGLKNIVAEQQRIETYQPAQDFDQITTRAFTNLPNMLDWLDHLMQPATELLAMKGQLPVDEIKQLAELGFDVIEEPLNVPQVEGERYLLLIKRHEN